MIIPNWFSFTTGGNPNLAKFIYSLLDSYISSKLFSPEVQVNIIPHELIQFYYVQEETQTKLTLHIPDSSISSKLLSLEVQ
jgi:hypothetical protein